MKMYEVTNRIIGYTNVKFQIIEKNENYALLVARSFLESYIKENEPINVNGYMKGELEVNDIKEKMKKEGYIYFPFDCFRVTCLFEEFKRGTVKVYIKNKKG